MRERVCVRVREREGEKDEYNALFPYTSKKRERESERERVGEFVCVREYMCVRVYV